MMYMWNGFSMIKKCPELTEGMLQTVVEAERTLLESPGNNAHSKLKNRDGKETLLRKLTASALVSCSE